MWHILLVHVAHCGSCRGPTKVRKGVASRYFRLLSGHAATGTYLAEKVKAIRSSERWWCGSGERQSRHHLFVSCRAWSAQVKNLWRSVEEACEWKHPRAPAAGLLFQDERATPTFLVLALPEEWGELEIVLLPEGGRKARAEKERRADRARTENVFFLCRTYFFCSFHLSYFLPLFSFLPTDLGRRGKSPTRTAW